MLIALAIFNGAYLAELVRAGIQKVAFMVSQVNSQVIVHPISIYATPALTLETVARGEVVVVCGRSGSGKSTLIRTINRWGKSTPARYWWTGRPFTGGGFRSIGFARVSASCSNSSISSRS